MITSFKYFIIGLFDSFMQVIKIYKKPPGQSSGILSPLLETMRIGHVYKQIYDGKIG